MTRSIRDRRQISFLILSKFKQINQFLFPLKSENHGVPDDFREAEVNSFKFTYYWKRDSARIP